VPYKFIWTVCKQFSENSILIYVTKSKHKSNNKKRSCDKVITLLFRFDCFLDNKGFCSLATDNSVIIKKSMFFYYLLLASVLVGFGEGQVVYNSASSPLCVAPSSDYNVQTLTRYLYDSLDTLVIQNSIQVSIIFKASLLEI